MRRCTTILILLIALSSCSSGPAININLVGIPEGTQVLQVNRALNGVMAMEPRIFTSFDPPKVRLRLAPGEVGSVRLMVDAMNETADRMRCVLASGEGVVIVGTADVETTIELRPGQMGCEPIDPPLPPPPDLSTPDLSLADLQPPPDMKCVPTCRPDQCEVSDGCNGTCSCAAGMVCDTMTKTCGECLHGRTQTCDVCMPDGAFDGVELNKGSATCQNGTWGACGRTSRTTFATKAGDPLWSHRCGFADGAGWRVNLETSNCNMIEGSKGSGGSSFKGRTLPAGRYVIRFTGETFGLTPSTLWLYYSLNDTSAGKDVFSSSASYSFNPPPGMGTKWTVDESYTFTVGSDCHPLLFKVTANASAGAVGAVTINNIYIQPL